MVSCRTLSSINLTDQSMLTLKSAIERVSEAWTDAVASAIQTGQVNTIINTCNNANGQIKQQASQLAKLLEQLEQLAE